jgi:hypothetical protein
MADQRDDKGGVAAALPTDALREAGQQLLSLLVQRATEAAAQRVTGLADRLTDVTDSGGDFRAVLGGKAQQDGQVEDADDAGDADDAEDRPGGLKGALVGLKDKMKNAFGGGGGSGGAKKLKMTSIIESVDVGLPLRTTYDTWTQFADFPSFMKKVETVEQESDEKTNWTAKVFWSRRTWEATIVEQVPDSHIVWRSTGAKGHVDGGVSFTALGPNLTRVLLVLEYWPQGFFERTGNLWRAQGRRARLEFKHFRRHAMTNVLLRQEEVEGWRGEIRDSEVVKTHEEALEEEHWAFQEGKSATNLTALAETGPNENVQDAIVKDGKLPEDKPKGEAAEEESDVNDRNLNVIQRIPVKWPDSVDGSEASEAVTFALDGRRYTLDLSKDNAARLREALAPFVAVARRSRSGGRDRRGSRQAVVPGRQR